MVGEPIDSQEALLQAYQAITNGRGDPNGVEGAKINALESIAWSLIGLLARRIATVEGDLEVGFEESLKELGLLKVGSRREDPPLV